jgi:hypothetical protein
MESFDERVSAAAAESPPLETIHMESFNQSAR